MAKTKISKAAKNFNISISTLVEFLQKKGITVDNPENPNTRIDEAAYDLLVKEYDPDRKLKAESDNMSSQRVKAPEKPKAPEAEEVKLPEPQLAAKPKFIGKIDLATGKPIVGETAARERGKGQSRKGS